MPESNELQGYLQEKEMVDENCDPEILMVPVKCSNLTWGRNWMLKKP
jgi:hypothetical protein